MCQSQGEAWSPMSTVYSVRGSRTSIAGDQGRGLGKFNRLLSSMTYLIKTTGRPLYRVHGWHRRDTYRNVALTWEVPAVASVISFDHRTTCYIEERVSPWMNEFYWQIRREQSKLHIRGYLRKFILRNCTNKHGIQYSIHKLIWHSWPVRPESSHSS